MKSPRLPYYYYLPLAIISLCFTLSVAYTSWIGIGSWNLNRTINWGYGWFPGMSPVTMMYITPVSTSLPMIAIAIYFLSKFFKRQDLHLIGAMLLTLLGVLLSMLSMTLVR